MRQTPNAPFRSASWRYQFADALIALTAPNIPGSGVVVEERYVSSGVLSCRSQQVPLVSFQIEEDSQAPIRFFARGREESDTSGDHAAVGIVEIVHSQE